jgi:hypothetical protein
VLRSVLVSEPARSVLVNLPVLPNWLIDGMVLAGSAVIAAVVWRLATRIREIRAAGATISFGPGAIEVAAG